MNDLRIGLVSLYLPGSSKIGVGHQVEGLANALADRGHRVTVLSPDHPGDDARYRFQEVPGGPPVRLARFPWNLRTIDWNEYDILHAHGEDWFLAGIDRPAHVRTLHGSGFSEAKHITGAVQRIRMAAIGAGELVATVLADEVVGVSEATRRVYPWIDGVIPCGVDLTRFGGDPHPEPVPTILFVGTYENRKRGRLLQDAFREVIRPRMPTARLWMVCSDAPADDGVEVLGRLTDDELADRYRRAWVFCLPSTYEGFGVPYIEAMAAGCPVVATRNPGAVEVLGDGAYGDLVDDDDLGTAIADLLEDDARRRTMSIEGRARSVEFGWDRIVDQYEARYASAMATGRRARRTAR